jgi:Escherichia/Staphylococcus phage prohead protease
MSKIQYRSFEPEAGELRAMMEDDQMVIEGYAAKYNVQSHLLSERGIKFIEVLETGTFRDRINDEVYFTFNHSKDKVMAHTRNKSLTLSEDKIGLKFRAILNNTSDSRDLYERVLRGDVVENSFGFRENPEKTKLDRVAGSVPTKRISGIENLFDVSVVTKAAYPQTEVYVRELDEEVTEEPKTYDSAPYKRELELIKIKNNIN